ncbi:MAG: c-type cytochrome, partial [Pirellulaceae bacterium]|nr:c-type cytochrome [Pirellulaceae bacterium]
MGYIVSVLRVTRACGVSLMGICAIGWLAGHGAIGLAQESHTHHQADSPAGPKAPKLFLDKSPKVVEYQLKRLSNAELLLAERRVDSPKYIPVYAAILSRAAIPTGERRAAAEALAKLKSSSVVVELLAALGALTADDAETARSARDLISSLLAEPKAELLAQASVLSQSLASSTSWARRAAAAALLTAGQVAAVRAHAKTDASGALDALTAIAWLPDAAARSALRGDVVAMLASAQPVEVRRQAIRTLGTIAVEGPDKFARLVKLYDESELRDEAVRAMLGVPAAERDRGLVEPLATRLVVAAEATPIADRTSDSYIDAVQLAETLLPVLPEATSRAYRARLQAVSVRVVRIRTVEEEMRYDIKYFAVEAGRPVEIVLKNEDLMPHNLVITVPGALKEIAMVAATMAPDQVTDGKQYVPASDKVLWATTMVPAGKQERLAFEAPKVPGEYPFVCTFPNHWMRMYGVMVVVPDLDAWQKQPTTPADPIGNNRSFVRKWTMPDLVPELGTGLRGRSAEIGARLLKEATCLQCHKMRGEGGIVGPDLTDVAKRLKGDHQALLQELLDPSHKVDARYAVQQVLTTEGKVYSGSVVEETKESLSLIASPDQPMPIKIARDDIDEIVKSSKSIMPVGLLDQYT